MYIIANSLLLYKTDTLHFAVSISLRALCLLGQVEEGENAGKEEKTAS